MIKAIIFDVTGVMTSKEDPVTIQWAARKYKIKKSVLEPIYNRCFTQYELGKFNTAGFHKKFFKAIKKPVDKGFLRKKLSFKKPVLKVMQFVKQLAKKYPVYYLTNESSDYWSWVVSDKRYPLDKIVRKGFVSARIGHRKPSSAIFRHVLKQIRRKPSEVLYFDDTMRHVKGARKVGINAVQFTTLQKCRKDLKRYKVI